MVESQLPKTHRKRTVRVPLLTRVPKLQRPLQSVVLRADDEPGDNPPAGQDPRDVLERVLEVAHLRGGPKLAVEVEALGGRVGPAGLGVALSGCVVLRHGPRPRGKDGLVFAILLAEYGTPEEHCFDGAVLGFFHEDLKTRNDQTLFSPLNYGHDKSTMILVRVF